MSETDRLVLTDDDFLTLVGEERKASIGFDNDDELVAARETALNYTKGLMPDVPAMPNRSKAVSSDVSDAIETAMPDLVEIFIGGDDVVSFQPQGPDDENQAALETSLVQSAVFDANAGFLMMYSIIKDALQARIGVAKAWWESSEKTEDVHLEAIEPGEYPVLQQLAEEEGAELVDVVEGETYSCTLRRTKKTGRLKTLACPPEDFTFAADTVLLSEATYCALRSRRRAQALIDEGYEPDLVDKLPAHGANTDAIEQARDRSGESEHATSDASKPMRMVEIVEHYIRVDADDDGKTELWRVVTGSDERVLLDKEQVDVIPFGVITPYIVTHRLAGYSLADLLIEIQRIKTALLRMLLDSGYFALNQRVEVATAKANQFTISDLLRNEPGVPIRSTTGDAVRPVSAGALAFDVTGALEYVSTIAEGRTGIVRNAQGLNPDTLHDTATGANQLISAAQKRLRLIARIFAETGLKDLFLIVHHLMRTNGTAEMKSVGGGWQEVDPSTWPARDGLRVEIGVGAGGREHDLIAGSQLIGMLKEVVAGQGGQLEGPLTTAEGVYRAVKAQTKRLGFRNPELFWRDPKTYQSPPPQPSPELQKVQIQAQADAEQAKLDHQLAMAELEQKGQLEREKIAGELSLKRDQIAAEIRLREAEQFTSAQMGAGLPAGADVHVGGEPG